MRNSLSTNRRAPSAYRGRSRHVVSKSMTYLINRLPFQPEEKKEKPEEKKPEEKDPVNAVVEAKELTALALKGALSVQHQQRLLALLDQEPHVVYEIGVTPNQVPHIIVLLLTKEWQHVPSEVWRCQVSDLRVRFSSQCYDSEFVRDGLKIIKKENVTLPSRISPYIEQQFRHDRSVQYCV